MKEKFENNDLESKDIRCEICQRPFKNKGGLTRHLRKTHPAEYEVIMEKEIRTEYEESPKKFDDDERFVKSRILVGKYELYLLHNRIDDAIEQLRHQILIYLKYYENPPISFLRFKENSLSTAQNVARNCLRGFLFTLNKKYKENIPLSILLKIETMIRDLESSSSLNGFHIEIPKIEKKEGLQCLFCGQSTKSRGGLSNHLRKAHSSEYLIQLKFELAGFERRFQIFLNREAEPLLQKKEEGEKISINDIEINITIKSSFNLTIENDFDTLEYLIGRKEYLIENYDIYSEQMYDHLLMLTNYDIEKIMTTIDGHQKFNLNKKNSYYFDAETKQNLIEKYQGLINEWKLKIDNLILSENMILKRFGLI